ncbi:MAG: DUF951 domain-containing protein [Chloroflexia bacterium]|nr:DUF951 domain-containing protein [Chloroflexia bacterium]
MVESSDIQVGMQVRLRKAHPCGGDVWLVTRVGSDVGLRCLTCGRRILLRRALFRRRLKAVLPPGEQAAGGSARR